MTKKIDKFTNFVRVPTKIQQLRPNQKFTRHNGEKVFIFEGHVAQYTKSNNRIYVYKYYALDNPYDERTTSNGLKNVDLLVFKPSNTMPVGSGDVTDKTIIKLKK